MSLAQSQTLDDVYKALKRTQTRSGLYKAKNETQIDEVTALGATHDAIVVLWIHNRHEQHDLRRMLRRLASRYHRGNHSRLRAKPVLFIEARPGYVKTAALLDLNPELRSDGIYVAANHEWKYMHTPLSANDIMTAIETGNESDATLCRYDVQTLETLWTAQGVNAVNTFPIPVSERELASVVEAPYVAQADTFDNAAKRFVQQLRTLQQTNPNRFLHERLPAGIRAAVFVTFQYGVLPSAGLPLRLGAWNVEDLCDAVIRRVTESESLSASVLLLPVDVLDMIQVPAVCGIDLETNSTYVYGDVTTLLNAKAGAADAPSSCLHTAMQRNAASLDFVSLSAAWKTRVSGKSDPFCDMMLLTSPLQSQAGLAAAAVDSEHRSIVHEARDRVILAIRTASCTTYKAVKTLLRTLLRTVGGLKTPARYAFFELAKHSPDIVKQLLTLVCADKHDLVAFARLLPPPPGDISSTSDDVVELQFGNASIGTTSFTDVATLPLYFAVTRYETGAEPHREKVANVYSVVGPFQTAVNVMLSVFPAQMFAYARHENVVDVDLALAENTFAAWKTIVDAYVPTPSSTPPIQVVLAEQANACTPKQFLALADSIREPEPEPKPEPKTPFTIYGAKWCPWTQKAMAAIGPDNYTLVEVSGPTEAQEKSGINHPTIPIVLEHGTFIGGATETIARLSK